jgi:hypothetical protein
MVLPIVDGGTGANSAAGARVSLETDQAAHIQFTAPGTGAAERSVEEKLADFISVRDFGAAGDGATDDTAAIQAAIDAGGTGCTIFFPPGTYRITSTVRIGEDRVHLRCSGGWSTTFVFAPTADDVMFHFEKSDGASILFQCSVTGGCGVTSGDTTFRKTAFRVVDHSAFQIRDVNCNGWHTASGGNSIILQIAGREWGIVDNIVGACDLALHFQKNGHVYSGNPANTIDVDHHMISRVYSSVTSTTPSLTMDTGGGSRGLSPSILIDSGVNLTTTEIRYCALVAGTDGIVWHDTASSQASTALKIAHVRFEQGTSALGYAVYLRHNYALQDLDVEMVEAGAGRGIYLRKVQRASVSHLSYAGTSVGFDAEATDINYTLRLENCFFQVGSTVTTNGYHEVFAVSKGPTGTGPRDAFYAFADSGLTVTTRRNGVFTREYQGSLASNATAALDIGTNNGVKLARIEVATVGPTKRESGVALLSAGNVVRESGTAGFDVGNVPGKVTVSSSTAPVLRNQLGETIDYMVTAKFIR